MLLDFVILICGFALLIKGADFFVDGASNLAMIFKIPAVIIGLTIVAFGTSAPEASVSIQAALSGSNDIAISNIIGSNIFNLTVCLGASSLVGILVVPRSIIKRDFPFLIVISCLLLVFAFTNYEISGFEGLILLALIISYVISMIRRALANTATTQAVIRFGPFTASSFIAIGFLGILAGGEFVVTSASNIALEFGLSEKLIGLTIISIGTSLPELVTSIVATKKGQVDIAIGNVIGSNIFNILFILGTTASISPVFVQAGLIVDLIVIIIITVLCYYFAKREQRITKQNGICLLLIFCSYLIFIIARN